MTSHSPDLYNLFMDALEMESPEQRAAFLERACGEDQELRDKVEHMLAKHRQLGNFLVDPPTELVAKQNLLTSLEAGMAPNALGSGTEGIEPNALASGLPGQRSLQKLPRLAPSAHKGEAPDAEPSFGEEQAVVLGGANHSVLRSLGHTVDVPRVSLREPGTEEPEPITQPRSPEMPQTESDGRYQLQGLIARGGMGAIIKGRDMDLGRDLAIKVLLDQHKGNLDVIQRFIEEAQIGGQLQHPGIAPVYELGQFADQRPFFSMKLVKGETLAKLLVGRKTSADERAKFLGIFEQVCQTMAYAHSRGVIHRDLKPANIMVGAFGEVQVMDWGLAKVMQAGGVADEKLAQSQHKHVSVIQTLRHSGSDVPGSSGSAGSQTQLGSVMGTPAYMPPEQALGEIDQLDQRADVFGLGAILCEILTGQPPYVSEDSAHVFRLAARGALEEAFSRLDACDADSELITLAKECLSVEPRDRPSDASALAARVTGYLESVENKLRETELERASEAARAVEQKRRLRVTMALSASVLLVFACGIAGTTWQAFQAERARAAEAERAEGERLANLEAQRQQGLASARADEARLRAYVAEVNIAFQAIDGSNLARARTLLDRQRANRDLLGMEWRYLWQRTQGDQIAALTFESGLQDIEFSPDGAVIAFALGDGGVSIRDVASRKEVAHLPVGANTIAFSPNGDVLATATFERDVKLWNTKTWLEERSLKNARCPAVFSPDGKWLMTGGTQDRHIWDTATWEQEARQRSRNMSWHVRHAVSFSPDSKWLVTPKDWEQIELVQLPELTPYSEFYPLSGRISTIKFLTDGKRLLAGRFDDGSLSVVDVETGEVSDLMEAHAAWITVVDAAADGKTFVTASADRTVVIWDAIQVQPLAKLQGHLAEIWALAMSPDGKSVVSGSQDGTALFWDAGFREERKEAGGRFGGFVRRGKLFLSPSPNEAAGGESELPRDVDVIEVPESESDNFPAFVLGRSADLWNVTVHTREASWDALPGLWLRSQTFSPDLRFAARAESGQVVVWNVSDGRQVTTIEIGNQEVSLLALTHDAHRLACAGNSDVTVWDVATGQQLRTLDKQNGAPSSLAFSPDGNLLAIGTLQGNEVNLWRIPSGELVSKLQGHLQGVSGVAFSVDGRTLATGSHDGRLKLWNVATQQEIMTKKFSGPIMRVCFAPDDVTLAVGYRLEGKHPHVQFLQAATWEEIEAAESKR